MSEAKGTKKDLRRRYKTNPDWKPAKPRRYAVLLDSGEWGTVIGALKATTDLGTFPPRITKTIQRIYRDIDNQIDMALGRMEKKIDKLLKRAKETAG